MNSSHQARGKEKRLGHLLQAGEKWEEEFRPLLLPLPSLFPNKGNTIRRMLRCAQSILPCPWILKSFQLPATLLGCFLS